MANLRKSQTARFLKACWKAGYLWVSIGTPTPRVPETNWPGQGAFVAGAPNRLDGTGLPAMWAIAQKMFGVSLTVRGQMVFFPPPDDQPWLEEDDPRYGDFRTEVSKDGSIKRVHVYYYPVLIEGVYERPFKRDDSWD